jgi:hypothetical protein
MRSDVTHHTKIHWVWDTGFSNSSSRLFSNPQLGHISGCVFHLGVEWEQETWWYMVIMSQCIKRSSCVEACESPNSSCRLLATGLSLGSPLRLQPSISFNLAKAHRTTLVLGQNWLSIGQRRPLHNRTLADPKSQSDRTREDMLMKHKFEGCYHIIWIFQKKTADDCKSKYTFTSLDMQTNI